MPTFPTKPNFKYKERGAQGMRKKNEEHASSVMTSHPIYITLRCKYGLDVKKRTRLQEESKIDDESNDENYSNYYVYFQCYPQIQ